MWSMMGFDCDKIWFLDRVDGMNTFVFDLVWLEEKEMEESLVLKVSP